MIDKYSYTIWYKLTASLVKILHKHKVKAWYVTLLGVITAIIAATLIYLGYYYLALVFILLSRIFDGLDGPIARLDPKLHPFGALVDNVGDFIFYGVIVVAFSLSKEDNMLPGLFLLLSFYLTGGSFLALAAIQSEQTNRQEKPTIQKGILYNSGIVEGGETIGLFILFTLFPESFYILAWVFSGLCVVTVSHRLWQVKRWLIVKK